MFAEMTSQVIHCIAFYYDSIKNIFSVFLFFGRFSMIFIESSQRLAASAVFTQLLVFDNIKLKTLQRMLSKS